MRPRNPPWVPPGSDPAAQPGRAAVGGPEKLVWPSLGEYVRWRTSEWAGFPALAVAIGRANLPAAGEGLDELTLTYGDDPAQRLLLCRPAAEPGGDRRERSTAVLFVHGGSWKTQEPEGYRFVVRWFARRGFPAAAGGYRLVPGARWPAQCRDVAGAAVELMRRTGARRVLLAGHSAGAHLAAAALYAREERRALGLADSDVAGLIVMSGPLDWRLICPRPDACPLIQDLMGGDDGWDAADPARLVANGDPWPVLAVHGATDPLVNSAASVSFARRTERAGSPTRLRVLEGAGHSTLLWGFLDGREPGTVVERFAEDADASAAGEPVPAQDAGSPREEHS